MTTAFAVLYTTRLASFTGYVKTEGAIELYEDSAYTILFPDTFDFGEFTIEPLRQTKIVYVANKDSNVWVLASFNVTTEGWTWNATLKQYEFYSDGNLVWRFYMCSSSSSNNPDTRWNIDTPKNITRGQSVLQYFTFWNTIDTMAINLLNIDVCFYASDDYPITA